MNNTLNSKIRAATKREKEKKYMKGNPQNVNAVDNKGTLKNKTNKNTLL